MAVTDYYPAHGILDWSEGSSALGWLRWACAGSSRPGDSSIGIQLDEKGIPMAIREPIAALALGPTETTVAHVASRVFCALIGAGRLTDENCDELVEFAVRAAVDLARQVDRAVESDGETATRGSFGGIG